MTPSVQFLVKDVLLPTYTQMLRAVSSWLDKAEGDEMLSRRLASDMFPLSTQICFICLQAQEAVYRLQRKEIPQSLQSLADVGRKEEVRTVKDAKAKIEEALAFLESFEVNDGTFPQNETITLELPGGVIFENMTSQDFVRDWAIPQFYFHVVTAYSILRNAGVDLGKANYVTHMFAYLRPSTPSSEQQK